MPSKDRLPNSGVSKIDSKKVIAFHHYKSFFSKLKEHNQAIVDEEDYDEPALAVDEEYAFPDRDPELQARTEPFIVTADGIWPVKEYGPNGEIYSLWMVYTNFRITKTVVDIIDSIDGVETLEVFSSYRARVSFGKLFQPRNIMADISKQINDYFNAQEINIS